MAPYCYGFVMLFCFPPYFFCLQKEIIGKISAGKFLGLFDLIPMVSKHGHFTKMLCSR